MKHNLLVKLINFCEKIFYMGDDDWAIDKIHSVLKKQLKKRDPDLENYLRKRLTARNHLLRKIMGDSDIDIILKNKANNVFVIEVKTRKKGSTVANTFVNALKQLKVREGWFSESNRHVWDNLLFDDYKGGRYSFVYYNNAAKGQKKDEGIYILNVNPKKIKNTVADIKKNSDFISWQQLIDDLWGHIKSR